MFTNPFRKTESGIIVPTKRPVAVACGFCPALIWKHKEAKGRLFLHNGKPICVRCRILKGSKLAKKIRSDKGKYLRDVEKRDDFIQDNENQRIVDVAIESQKRAPQVSISKN